MGSLFIWGNMDLIGQLNKSVAGLGAPVPTGVNLNCNKLRLMSSYIYRLDHEVSYQRS